MVKKASPARHALSQGQVIARSITERDFQQTVIEIAQVYGWLVHAERPAKSAKGWRTPIQGDKGFPDLVLAKKGRLIFAELKSEKGQLRVEQGWWLSELVDTGTCEVYYWTPSQLEKLTAVLEGEQS